MKVIILLCIVGAAIAMDRSGMVPLPRDDMHVRELLQTVLMAAVPPQVLIDVEMIYEKIVPGGRVYFIDYISEGYFPEFLAKCNMEVLEEPMNIPIVLNMNCERRI